MKKMTDESKKEKQRLTEMGEKELLDYLQEWVFPQYKTHKPKWWKPRKAWQAYNQLREIVKEQITIDELLTQAGLKIAKDGSLIQQKPKVSIGWVSERVDKEWKDCEYQGPKYPHGPESYDVKGLIVNILKELGWKVEGG